MKYKNIGIFALLIAIWIIGTLCNGRFVSNDNVQTLIRWVSLFGLLGIGVMFVIVTGGIDLSIGSQVALIGCIFIWILNIQYEPLAGFQTTILEKVDDPTAAQLRLAEVPADLRDGDQLTYEYFASRQVTVAGLVTRQRDGEQQTWVQLRGSFSDDISSIQVGVRKLRHTSPWLAVGLSLLVALGIGLLHGVLVTYARLQPFIVTLCGLLIYRGIARVMTGDDQVGLQTTLGALKRALIGQAFSVPVPFTRWISDGNWSRFLVDPQGNPVLDQTGQPIALGLWQWISIPVPGLILAVVAMLSWFFFQRTVWGRHLLALGRNEQAARFSGIPTRRLVIAAYAICSTLVGLAAILFTLDLNSIQPGSTGNPYELYAIAAAVLGGCSLRGGEASVIGVVVGTAVMRSLYSAITVLGIPSAWEYVIISLALLSGVIFDEVVRRVQVARRTVKR
jgi:ribose transport system permease protein